MGADYIPRGDARFKLWAETFVGTIRQQPSQFFLTPAQADWLNTLLERFVEALLISSQEGTRTRPTILSKTNARHALESLCRTHARLIKDNLGIPDSDKLALGIRPINVARSPIHCPGSSPLVSFLYSTNTCHVLRYKDPHSGGKAKPFGAAGVQLFMAVTFQKNAPLSEGRFVGVFTRNPIRIVFKQDQDGLAATYWARWSSERGQTGPFSIPISIRIAA